MIILSCALWANWLPLLVGMYHIILSEDSLVEPARFLALTFVVAPLPNAIFAHCGADDFSTDCEGSGPVDLGRFITAIIVVTGFALPLVLAHSEIIKPAACAMSIIGGACVLIFSVSWYNIVLIYLFICEPIDLYMEPSLLIPLPSDKKIPSMIDALCVYLHWTL